MTTSAAISRPAASSRSPLREGYLAERRAEAQPVDTKDFRSYLRDFFQFEDMTADLGNVIQFRLTDGPSVWIDFRKKPYRYLTECEEPASYVLTLESAWVSLVLQGKLTWHELLMSREVTITRDPDRDVPKLMQHFDYRHDEALFDLVRLLDPALITVQDEQMEYVCQRFCPHRGRDLEYASSSAACSPAPLTAGGSIFEKGGAACGVARLRSW